MIFHVKVKAIHRVYVCLTKDLTSKFLLFVHKLSVCAYDKIIVYPQSTYEREQTNTHTYKRARAL